VARSPRGEVDIALKIFDAVKNALTVSGLPEEMADRYAYFAVEMYKYIEARPQPQGALQSAKSTFDGGRGGQKPASMRWRMPRVLLT
jgi:hypothetical protein